MQREIQLIVTGCSLDFLFAGYLSRTPAFTGSMKWFLHDLCFFSINSLCSYRGNVVSWQWLWLLQYCGSHCISESLFHFFWIWNKWCPIDTAKARHWTVACNWHMWERNKNLFLLAHWGGAYFGVCRFRTQETRCWWTDIAHGLCWTLHEMVSLSNRWKMSKVSSLSWWETSGTENVHIKAVSYPHRTFLLA